MIAHIASITSSIIPATILVATQVKSYISRGPFTGAGTLLSPRTSLRRPEILSPVGPAMRTRVSALRPFTGAGTLLKIAVLTGDDLLFTLSMIQ